MLDNKSVLINSIYFDKMLFILYNSFEFEWNPISLNKFEFRHMIAMNTIQQNQLSINTKQ